MESLGVQDKEVDKASILVNPAFKEAGVTVKTKVPNRSSQGNREDADEEDGQGSCSYKRTLITESKAANRLRKLMQILFPMVQKVQLTLMEMCTDQFHKKMLLPKRM